MERNESSLFLNIQAVKSKDKLELYTNAVYKLSGWDMCGAVCMRGNRVKLLKKLDINAIFRFCLAFRKEITIILQENISTIKLNSISSLNFHPNMAKNKHNQ